MSGGAEPLTVELAPLAQVWLSLPLSSNGTAWAWLRAQGVVGAVSAPGADLCGADLRGANLRGADLRGAWRLATDPAVPVWTVRDGRMERAL